MFTAGKLEKRYIISVAYLPPFDKISIDFTRLTESLNIHCKVPCNIEGKLKTQCKAR
jgi:hypothetical protein